MELFHENGNYPAMKTGDRLRPPQSHRSGSSGAAAVIEDALRRALDLLWANLLPRETLSDEQAFERLRRLVRSRKVRAALAGSATFLAATLRAVRRVLLDQDGRTARQRIGELWCILDVPPVNDALGIDNNRRLVGTAPPRRVGSGSARLLLSGADSRSPRLRGRPPRSSATDVVPPIARMPVRWWRSSRRNVRCPT
jgi:hypothetical protein